MLFESLLQPKIFLIVFAVGFFCGLLFDLAAYIVFLCKQNKIVQIVFEFFATVLSFAVFFLTILLINYGEFRFYQFISFFGALLLERWTLGKLIDKLFNWCYNFFTKSLQKVFNKRKKCQKKTN